MMEDTAHKKAEKKPPEEPENITCAEQVSKLPRHRSVLSLTAGLLLIGICLLFIAASIAICLSNDLKANPIAALFSLYVGIWIIVQQYRLLFCCPPATTRHIFGWLLFFAFCIFYTLSMELVGTSRSWEDLYKVLAHPVTIIGFPIVSIFTALDITAYRERKRRQKLVEIYLNQDDWYFTDIAPLFRKYKTREIVGLVLLAIFLGMTTAYCVWRMPPKSGEHYTFEQMPRLGLLPEDGSDFNFKYPNRGRFACDFHITEEGFRKWVFTHSRYTDCEEVVDMPLPEHKLLDQSVVINGLLAVPDGKSHNGVCFDRKTQRAYYWLWRTPQ